jgi:hypothetical protein
LINAGKNFFDIHFLPAVKCVRRVAPCASQIAPSQPHKNTRQPGSRALSLNRFEDFSDDHIGGSAIVLLLFSYHWPPFALLLAFLGHSQYAAARKITPPKINRE